MRLPRPGESGQYQKSKIKMQNDKSKGKNGGETKRRVKIKDKK